MKMGSLSSPFPNPHEEEINFSKAKLDKPHLLNLFKCQQNYLNHFFQNLDLSQTLTFTETLIYAEGSIFFFGVGKSGFVTQKISQTLVSLGIKSAFLSPVDALHDDIGILSAKDLLVMFSKSGNSEELLKLVPCAKAKRVYLISVTSVKSNGLMRVYDLNVHLPLEREFCPFDLAPVTSTAIQMVFGDTVAIVLLGARNLSKEEYAANHPAGRTGKSLIFKESPECLSLELISIVGEVENCWRSRWTVEVAGILLKRFIIRNQLPDTTSVFAESSYGKPGGGGRHPWVDVLISLVLGMECLCFEPVSIQLMGYNSVFSRFFRMLLGFV